MPAGISNEGDEVFLNCMPHSFQNRWYWGEIGTSGLCNMLFGVYSLIPMARLLNSSLIVAYLYSRKSYEVTYMDYIYDPIKLPFSRFYDWHHFSNHWEKLQLPVVEQYAIENCLNITSPASIDRYGAGSQNDKQLLQWVVKSNLTIPLSPNVSFINIGSPFKNVGLYSHWQSKDHLTQLLDLHSSLIPAKPLRAVIKQQLQQISPVFYAAHIRVEGDVIDHEDKEGKIDHRFHDEWPKVLSKIVESSCYQMMMENTEHGNPTLYLTSGIFVEEEESFLYKRARRVLKDFIDLGINPVYKNITLMKDLFLEQQSLIELEIAKSSVCFIPSPIQKSSFSYTVLRQKQLEQAIRDKTGVNELRKNSIGYYDWSSWGY
eukprot:gene5029-7018_t